MKIAIYPGSFDPVTFGHMDIIKRSSLLFDKLIIAIAYNNNKNSLFSVKDRISMIEKELINNGLNNDLDNNIEVTSFNNLLVDFAKKKKVNIIVRGLRVISDFEYEFQMARMNNKLSDIETIFLPASEENHFISSRLVKEIFRLKGDVSKFVSHDVIKYLQKSANK